MVPGFSNRFISRFHYIANERRLEDLYECNSYKRASPEPGLASHSLVHCMALIILCKIPMWAITLELSGFSVNLAYLIPVHALLWEEFQYFSKLGNFYK